MRLPGEAWVTLLIPSRLIPPGNAIDSAKAMPSRPPDAIALLAVPLVVAAFLTGGVVLPTICLCLAGASVVYVIAGHDELSRRRRIVICVLVIAVDVVMLGYLYKSNLAGELRQQAAPLIAATLPSPVSSNCPIPRGAVA